MISVELELRSSQQCEQANKEVTLRAPNPCHYGKSESLDFGVHASAAFVNEGRSYIFQVRKFTNSYRMSAAPKPCSYLHFNRFYILTGILINTYAFILKFAIFVAFSFLIFSLCYSVFNKCFAF